MNYVVVYQDDYLAHHGIKGQKWGVRRWQYENGSLTPAGYRHYGYGQGKHITDKPSPISQSRRVRYVKQPGDVTLPRGTTFQRIATGANAGYTQGVYASYRNADKDLYKGELGRLRLAYQHKTGQDAKLYEVKMRTNKSLHIPSREKRLEKFKELYKEDPETTQAFINEHESSRYGKKGIKRVNLEDKKSLEQAYRKFNDALAMGGNSANKSVIDKFYNKLKKEGYDAIPDENDIRLSTFKAQAPLILFDTSKSIAKTESRELSASEVFGAYQRAAGKKMVRDFIMPHGVGRERLSPQTVRENAAYQRQLRKDKSILNENYTLADLAKDFGEHRLSNAQIRKVSSKMDEGYTHDEAVKQYIHYGNIAVNWVMSKYERTSI